MNASQADGRARPRSAKSVLMVIIDALATRAVEPAMSDGRLPNLARLAASGTFTSQCWSIFPSITPAATGTLHTGVYPNEHGVAGAYWYDRSNDRVAYFGDDIWAILTRGHGQYFHDFQVTLNYDHLRVPTIYEYVRKAGLRSACLNSMWFKADVPHKVHLPTLLKLMPGVKSAQELGGPEILALADFVTTDHDGSGRALTAPGGMSRRYGFHDETTAGYLLDLASRGPLPDLTVAYFPNYDFESHDHGPMNSVETLQFVDKTLGELFEARGGLQQFLNETAILITGDHSQSDTADDDGRRSIDLDDVLSSFSLVPAGEKWDDGDQLMVCPNMRAAQVYIRDGEPLRDRVTAALLEEPRVDQVLWTTPAPGEPKAYHVATSDRGKLSFRPGSGFSNSARDVWGTLWSWEGDLAAVSGDASNGEISFGTYPNAFERIAGAFFDETGHLLVTPRVGHEFEIPRTTTHRGGSHGSLHALDSTAPLITAGLPERVTVPSPARTVDFVPIALQALGVDFPYAPAQGRPPK